MQKPFTIAVVGKGRSRSCWNTSQPSLTNSIASAPDLNLVNCSTSAPAMKPSFAERITSPFGSRAQRKCFAQVLASARSMVPPLQRFEQHRAAQPAADADRRQAALGIVALQHFQQMQHDACARGAHRVAEGNGAAVHIQSFLVYFAQRSIKAQFFAA